jgi:hypothetical protein
VVAEAGPRRAARASWKSARESARDRGRACAREGIRERRKRQREDAIGLPPACGRGRRDTPCLLLRRTPKTPLPARTPPVKTLETPSLRGRWSSLRGRLLRGRRRPPPYTDAGAPCADASCADAGDHSLLLASLPYFFTDREVLCSLPTENREGPYVPLFLLPCFSPLISSIIHI